MQTCWATSIIDLPIPGFCTFQGVLSIVHCDTGIIFFVGVLELLECIYILGKTLVHHILPSPEVLWKVGRAHEFSEA